MAIPDNAFNCVLYFMKSFILRKFVTKQKIYSVHILTKLHSSVVLIHQVSVQYTGMGKKHTDLRFSLIKIILLLFIYRWCEVLMQICCGCMIYAQSGQTFLLWSHLFKRHFVVSSDTTLPTLAVLLLFTEKRLFPGNPPKQAILIFNI